MRRSTWLIINGLMLAVAPIVLNGLGTVMVRAYGRNGLGELLAWSILLLIVSIPIGAALVVAGVVAKMVDRPAKELAAAVPVSAECPNCGTAIDWQATECPKCRALFGAQAAWKPVAPRVPPASKASSRSRLSS